MSKKAISATDEYVDTELMKKLVIQLLAETEELQSYLELHCDLHSPDEGRLSDDEANRSFPEVVHVTNVMPVGSEQDKFPSSTAAEKLKEEAAKWQEALNRKEEMISWLRSKASLRRGGWKLEADLECQIMRFADLLKELRDDSMTTLRHKDKLIAELQMELVHAAERGQDDSGNVELASGPLRNPCTCQGTQTAVGEVRDEETSTREEGGEDIRFSILKPDTADKDAAISHLNDDNQKLRYSVLLLFKLLTMLATCQRACSSAKLLHRGRRMGLPPRAVDEDEGVILATPDGDADELARQQVKQSLQELVEEMDGD
eukprot:370222-Hanusia_phi.AAC.4